jgi:hypothetical protein
MTPIRQLADEDRPQPGVNGHRSGLGTLKTSRGVLPLKAMDVEARIGDSPPRTRSADYVSGHLSRVDNERVEQLRGVSVFSILAAAHRIEARGEERRRSGP